MTKRPVQKLTHRTTQKHAQHYVRRASSYYLDLLQLSLDSVLGSKNCVSFTCILQSSTPYSTLANVVVKYRTTQL